MTFDVSHLALRVWQRNMDTFLSLWKTESWPPFVEPLMHLMALGYGVGAYVSNIGDQSYAAFIAPGIVASGAMFSSSFEGLFGTFLRMTYQRTFDAIIATPASLDDVILGELLYGAARGTVAAIGVLVVLVALGLVGLLFLAAALPIAFLASLMFTGMAVFYTSFAPSFTVFNYYITLLITPMFLFSGIFFPVEQLPAPLQAVAWISPLSHVVAPLRALAHGQFGPADAGHLALVVVLALVFGVLAIIRMRTRLIR